jgi:hypothetical protein
VIGGRGNSISRSFLDELILSKQRRSAVVSPYKAKSMAFWIIAGAWPSSISSDSSVDLFRLPTGRRAGLPLVPLVY